MNKPTLNIIILILTLFILVGCNGQQSAEQQQEAVKIGVITDLSGFASYWGESTFVGTQIALKELQTEGYNVEFIIEDYKLDPKQAVSAANKLIDINKVNALYSELTGAMAIVSNLKDKQLFHLYSNPATSPLQDAPYVYKSYLDYQTGCKLIAQKFKDHGVDKIGMLKMNHESGELCLLGLKEIYPENILIESYNIGETDFKTQVLKLKNNGAQTIINVAFEDDTSNTLKVIKEFEINLPYGTVDDSITDQVIKLYSKQLSGAITFGFVDVNDAFIQKIEKYFPDKKLTTYYGAALAYTHLKQMARIIKDCSHHIVCITKQMDNLGPEQPLQFLGFNNHVAQFEINIKEY